MNLTAPMLDEQDYHQETHQRDRMINEFLTKHQNSKELTEFKDVLSKSIWKSDETVLYSENFLKIVQEILKWKKFPNLKEIISQIFESKTFAYVKANLIKHLLWLTSWNQVWLTLPIKTHNPEELPIISEDTIQSQKEILFFILQTNLETLKSKIQKIKELWKDNLNFQRLKSKTKKLSQEGFFVWQIRQILLKMCYEMILQDTWNQELYKNLLDILQSYQRLWIYLQGLEYSYILWFVFDLNNWDEIEVCFKQLNPKQED